MLMATTACSQADQDKMADGVDKAKAAGQDLVNRANSALTDFLGKMQPDKEATATSLAATGETRIGEVPPSTELSENAANASPQETSEAAPEVVAKVTELREAVLLTIPAGSWDFENTSAGGRSKVTIDDNGYLNFGDGPGAQMRVPEMGSSEICFEQEGGLYCFTKETNSTSNRLSFSRTEQGVSYKVIFSK